jgi:hypothetical protein
MYVSDAWDITRTLAINTLPSGKYDYNPCFLIQMRKQRPTGFGKVSLLLLTEGKIGTHLLRLQNLLQVYTAF